LRAACGHAPLEARPRRETGIIWFVTDCNSSKEHEIEAMHEVGLVFTDEKAKACPKHLNPAQAIAEVKRMLVERQV
jgi:succinate dehydrogenase/fumarate reductase-like Fe-S protein